MLQKLHCPSETEQLLASLEVQDMKSSWKSFEGDQLLEMQMFKDFQRFLLKILHRDTVFLEKPPGSVQGP